ncbi:hypothetical protein K469DRAFT_694894 [Zopfia rhizophila CBS 207.26]|uniref:Uncharacterized protein n=1 Tax=Zopfia rhizophila CBS 207.26 TaxID=1314779 RepID=A0A6A6DMX5_9PEZI|nr:hypothetical protein K469DRAFT_694894 [Zopfia rhizophila CBS 207.26]
MVDPKTKKTSMTVIENAKVPPPTTGPLETNAEGTRIARVTFSNPYAQTNHTTIVHVRASDREDARIFREEQSITNHILEHIPQNTSTMARPRILLPPDVSVTRTQFPVARHTQAHHLPSLLLIRMILVVFMLSRILSRT